MKQISKGTIFIVDISGFTKLVQATNNEDGMEIVHNLLNAVIRNNMLSMDINEIEGDAILFYKTGTALSLENILAQFDVMLKAFNREKARWVNRFPVVQSLSIKAVVHYGEFSRYNIGGFDKLFGKALIDAHRLLKNSVGLQTYVLVTSQLLDLLGQPDAEADAKNFLCEWYDVGHLCYRFFGFEERVSEKIGMRNRHKAPAMPVMAN